MIFVHSALEKLSSSWHRVVKSTTNLQILSNSAALSSRSQCTANPYLTHYDCSRGFYYVRRSVPLDYYSDDARDKKTGGAMACTTSFTSAMRSQQSAFESYQGHFQHQNPVSPRSPRASGGAPLRCITPGDHVPAVGTY
jgi:hypothetical protein